MIPYGKQNIDESDIDAVIDVLKSDFLTQGPQVPRFEEAVKDYTSANYAVAVNSATSGLHIACMALELGKHDILWTSPISFVASANCALYCGAKVDFVDIDKKTYNICPLKLEEKLITAQKEGSLPKILVAVHLSGQPCDMQSLKALSDRFDFHLIEDASHAIGAKYKDQKVGSCSYSDITIFSFHPVKIITTAEGGMALTNSKKLAEKMALFRTHGITRDKDLMTEQSHGSWYYQQIVLGYNYRMTELQAALGISQMKRLDNFVTKRHEIAKRYDLLLKDLKIKLPFQSIDSYSSYHLYIIRLELDNISASHRMVFEGLREKGVGVNLHYIPIHLQPFYRSLGFDPGDFPQSEEYYTEAISLPLYPDLTKEDQAKVVSILSDLLKN